MRVGDAGQMADPNTVMVTSATPLPSGDTCLPFLFSTTFDPGGSKFMYRQVAQGQGGFTYAKTPYKCELNTTRVILAGGALLILFSLMRGGR